MASTESTSKATGFKFTAPLILFLIMLVLFPMLYNYYLSVHDATLANYFQPDFIGLKNYITVLKDKEFWKSILFSIEYATVVAFLEVVLGIALAIFFNRPMAGRDIWVALMLLPMMVSPALLATMFRLLLNDSVGLLTYLFGGKPLLTAPFIRQVLVGIDVLQWTPFAFLIIFSGLQTVQPELYEAASIDGAGFWEMLKSIVIPAIMPFIVIAFLLRWLDAFKIFDMIFVLTGGGPGIMTTSLSIYIYKMAFQSGYIGRATAGSVLIMIPFTIPLVVLLGKTRREV